MHHITWYRLLYVLAAAAGFVLLIAASTIAYFVGYENSTYDNAYIAEAIPVPIDEPAQPMMIEPMELTQEQIDEIQDQIDAHPMPIYWDTPHPNAKVLENGVAILHLSPPTEGTEVYEEDKVVIDWIGWTTDGNVLDSSYDRDWKTEFSLQTFIPGFSSALMQMREGDHVRAWIPAELAYKNTPGKPQGMLIFDISLHEVKIVDVPCMH